MGRRTKRQTNWKNSGKAEREASRNSQGASQEHTSETGQHGESKAVELLEGTERWEASPHQARYSAEVLNEVTMEEVLAASPWQDAVGHPHCRVQPPDAENRMSGGVGGSRRAIAATRPDHRHTSPESQRMNTSALQVKYAVP